MLRAWTGFRTYLYILHSIAFQAERVAHLARFSEGLLLRRVCNRFEAASPIMQRETIREYEKRRKSWKREIGGNDDESGEIPRIRRTGSSAVRVSGSWRARRGRSARAHRSDRTESC